MGNNVSTEQIERARAVHILDYIQSYEPFTLRQKSPGEYNTKEHDSFTMSDNGKWHWFSQKVGGVNALDYLVKVKNMDFVSAVKHLVGDATLYVSNTLRTSVPMEQKLKTFTLPAPSPTNEKIIEYLQSRGLSRELIQRCINEKRVYQDDKDNCVFVGYNPKGSAEFASRRSTYSDFKRDVAGSNKAYGFLLPEQTTKVAVFESAIDALSHAEIYRKRGIQFNRLALGGTSDVALKQYLVDNPSTREIYICLNADTPGQEATEKIIKTLISDARYNHVLITVGSVPIGQDYNDTLMAMQARKKQKEVTVEVNTNADVPGVTGKSGYDR